jgi:hypothetical protein
MFEVSPVKIELKLQQKQDRIIPSVNQAESRSLLVQFDLHRFEDAVVDRLDHSSGFSYSKAPFKIRGKRLIWSKNIPGSRSDF